MPAPTHPTHPNHTPSGLNRKLAILVLGGGPDSERDVSLISSQAVADALSSTGRFVVNRVEIDRLSIDDLKSLPGDVIFPVLHGGWGEGGPLQDLLEADSRPFVGSTSLPARRAMDKVATKTVAWQLNIPTAPVWLLDRRDQTPPCPLPLIIKPVHEGSTVGLYVCNSLQDWAYARQQIEQEDAAASPTQLRTYMIEPTVGLNPLVGGPIRDPRNISPKPPKARELTVGIIDNKALPVIEIVPAEGLYDYQAKYTRNDTSYLLDPLLPPGVREKIQDQTVRLALAMGIRHLARADFLLDSIGTAWFLEINTMPGFTSHSLVPMAANHIGVPMPQLCEQLISLAIRDHAKLQPHTD